MLRIRESVLLILAITILWQLLLPQSCLAEPKKTSSYQVGPNDVLNIYVWKEPEITREVTVMPDGKITIPLAGEISAQGQTVTQLSKAISEKLSKYVTLPEVTVIVKDSKSRIIYAIGKVLRPGPYPLAPNMTVLQALSAAGGFAEWADTKNVLIIRRDADRDVQIPFNYKAITSDNNLTQNILLRPGDTVVVP